MRNNLKSFVLAKNTGEMLNSYIQRVYKNKQYEKAANVRGDLGSAKASRERIESHGPIRAFRAQHQEAERAIKKSTTQPRRMPKNEPPLPKPLGLLSSFINNRKLSKPSYRVDFRRLSSSSLSSMRRRREDRTHHSQFPVESQYNELHSFGGPSSGANINYGMNAAMSKYLQPVRNQHIASNLGSLETAMDVSAKIQKDLMDVVCAGNSPAMWRARKRRHESSESDTQLAVPLLSQQEERRRSNNELLRKCQHIREQTESRHTDADKSREQSALRTGPSEKSIAHRKRLSDDYQRAAREPRPRVERYFKSQHLAVGAPRKSLSAVSSAPELMPMHEKNPPVKVLYPASAAKRSHPAMLQSDLPLVATPQAKSPVSDQPPVPSATGSPRKAVDYQRDFEERQKEHNIRKSIAAMKSASGTVMRPVKQSDGLDRSASSTGVRQVSNARALAQLAPAGERPAPWSLMDPPMKKKSRVELALLPRPFALPQKAKVLPPVETHTRHERVVRLPQPEASTEPAGKVIRAKRPALESAAAAAEAEKPGNLSASQSNAKGFLVTTASTQTVNRSYIDNTLLFDTLASSKPAAYQVAHSAASRISSLKRDNAAASRVLAAQAITKSQSNIRAHEAKPPSRDASAGEFSYAAQAERLPKAAAQTYVAHAKPSPAPSRQTPHRLSRIDLTAAALPKKADKTEMSTETTGTAARDSATSKYAGTARGMSVSNSRYNRTSFFNSRM